ncbi:MAG: hypothetical protein V1659_04095, partial [Candidatus Woesearchaeota archaeon]
WHNRTARYSSRVFTRTKVKSATIIYNLTPEGVQSKWQKWNCTVFVIAGGMNSGISYDDINISNSLPTVPTLQKPTNNNNSVRDRTPAFNWSDSTDADSDSITYQINITSNTGCGGDRYVTGISTSEYTPAQELCTYDEPAPAGGTVYNWTVRSCDNVGCSAWATKFNFTIEPYVIINITRDVVNFGSMEIEGTDNTTDDDPLPFLMQNNGNVVANLVNVSSNESLWDAAGAGLGTRYFQIKAGIAESGSFNVTASQMTWVNVTLANQSIIVNLDYNDSKDTAELDVLVEVPATEPAGTKTSTIIFTWGQG